VTGAGVTDITFAKSTLVGQTTATTFVDTKVKARETYTYWITVRYSDGTQSSFSNLAIVTVPK
jgi:fibronectin type 3 domain-containing protein